MATSIPLAPTQRMIAEEVAGVIGTVVGLARDWNKETQRDFADAVGVKQSTVSRIEQGTHVHAKLSTIVRLLDRYGYEALRDAEGGTVSKPLTELRAEARAHARQIDAVQWLTAQDLAARWGISAATVRTIPRERLPYLLLGAARLRRFDPRDVEQYEATMKHGDAA